MIELLTLKDNALYVAVVLCVVACLSIGYMIGHKDPIDVCSSYITDLDKEKQAHLKTVDELTTCKAKASGACVLDCVSVCDKQVQEALKNKNDWICDD